MFISSNKNRINQKTIQEMKPQMKQRITEKIECNLRKKKQKPANKIKTQLSKTEKS